MRVYHFSETAYPYLPPPEQLETVRVVFPSSNYDPKKGADIYQRRLDEWCAADELGLDIMLNEHHSTATCMSNSSPARDALFTAMTAGCQSTLTRVWAQSKVMNSGLTAAPPRLARRRARQRRSQGALW